MFRNSLMFPLGLPGGLGGPRGKPPGFPNGLPLGAPGLGGYGPFEKHQSQGLPVPGPQLPMPGNAMIGGPMGAGFNGPQRRVQRY